MRVVIFHLCSKELHSLICNYYSPSIHTGVAAFDYTPAPIETFPNPTVPQTWPFASHSEPTVSSAIPTFLATSLIFFLQSSAVLWKDMKELLRNVITVETGPRIA
jgi:hypothetical protein